MIRKYFSFFIFTLSFFCAQAQGVSWACSKDFSKRTWVRKVATDAVKNVISLSIYEDISHVANESGYVISKHDSVGSLLWEKRVENRFAYQRGYDLKVDRSGDIFLIANTADSVTLDGVTIFAQNGTSYCAKFSSSGNLQLIKQYRAQNLSMALEDDDNCYVTGFLAGEAHFDSISLNNAGPASADKGLLVLKINDSGNFEWAKTYGSWLSSGKLITLTPKKDIIVVGTFYEDSCVFANNTFSKVNGQNFIIKLDSTGVIKWAKQVRSYMQITSCVCDKFDNIYLSGYFWGTVNLDTTHFSTGITDVDVFVAKLNCNGEVLMGKSISGTEDQECYSSTLDKKDNLYLACTTTGTAFLDDNSITPNGIEDYFIAVLDSNLISKKIIEPEKTTQGIAVIYDISASSGNIFVGGTYTNTLSLGNQQFISYGYPKGFLARIDDSSTTDFVMESKNHTGLIIFPNPSSGIFDIVFPNKNSITKIFVYDVFGKCILSKEYQNQSLIIDLSDNPKGIYFVEIAAGDERVVRKIVIE